MCLDINQELKKIKKSIKDNFSIDSVIVFNEHDNTHSVVISRPEVYLSERFRDFASEAIGSLWERGVHNSSIICEPGLNICQEFNFNEAIVELLTGYTMHSKQNGWQPVGVTSIVSLTKINTYGISSINSSPLELYAIPKDTSLENNIFSMSYCKAA